MLAVAGCGAGDEEPPLLELTFDDLESPSSVGSADVSVTVVALGDGELRAVEGLGGDPAAGFPPFEATAAGDPVAIVVRSAVDVDPLSPGEAPFRFGADVRLDRESQGSAVDDGNNVLQRGLFDGPQYKIQLDGGVASCRVAGSSGAVLVKAEQPISPDEWYRIECGRDGDELTLRTTPLERDADDTVTANRGPIGAVTMEGEDAPPLTIGCKVDARGVPIASSTDQFNGAVDNVFFDVPG